jgi:hypothetical protein
LYEDSTPYWNQRAIDRGEGDRERERKRDLGKRKDIIFVHIGTKV